jgi:hypothetical protein
MVKKNKKSSRMASEERMRSEKRATFLITLFFSIGFIILLASIGVLTGSLLKEKITGGAVIAEECSKGIANISFEVDYNFQAGKNYSVIVASYRDNADNHLCERRGKVLDWENVTLPPIPVYGIDQHQNKEHAGKKENLVIDAITGSKIDFSIYAVEHKKLHSKETFVVLIQDLDCKPTVCKKHREKCDYKTGICCDVDDKDTWLEMDEFFNFSASSKDLYKKDCLDYSQCVTKIISPKINLKGDSHHLITVNQTFGQFKVTRIDKIIPLKCLNCTDDDGDGFFMEGGACGIEDCDDADASAYPGAPELCNGVDDNCNGNIDDGCLYAPTVSITEPSSGAEFKKYTPITFSATADDFDGNVTSFKWVSSRDGQLSTLQTFITAGLKVGIHIITLTVTDNDGLTASDNITIIIEEPDSPIVSIISPDEGDVFIEGTVVNFIGSAIPQGSAKISSIIWTSDGSIIFSSTNITNFSTSTLPAGVHTITLFATDNHGKTASYLIHIEIKEADAPTAAIISPIGRQFRVGQEITFGGSATPHGGSIVSQTWTSNREGLLGYGQTINVSTLSAGLHTITYKVTDSNGKIGIDTLQIEILDNDAPVASIFLPADKEHFKEGSVITFSGIGDQENITSYTWYSDIGSFLSHKQIFSTSSLGIGKHKITLLVYDDDGQTGSSTITIFIMPLLSPKVSIISPIDESDYRTGDTISFISSSSDPDGSITSYSWISSVDGVLSNQEAFSISNLSMGNHVITFTATDDDSQTSTSSVKISVKSPKAPTASIVQPLNGDHFRQFDEIEFIGSGSDPDGYITQWIWSSSINGVFGNSQNINSSCLSLGRHDITLTVIDNDGLKFIDTFTIWIEINPVLAPDVLISSPIPGTYKLGTAIFFDAVTSAIQSWEIVSSLDGIIKQGTGSFIPFSDSNLSLGHHFITLEVFNHGLSNSETVGLWVVPLQAPNVTIISPPSGVYSYGTNLLFNASIIGNWASITWNSNLEGNIGNQPEFNYVVLTPGRHLISVIVTNADNQTTIVQSEFVILQPPVSCGDTICAPGETCSTCPSDCGACPYCGDGSCNNGENCTSCSSDCGICPSVCGDSICNGIETCSTCPLDCGTCPPGGGGGGGGGRRCTENWLCSNWGDCINGERIRDCTDINHCGTTFSRPLLGEPCTVVLPAPTPTPTPTPTPVLPAPAPTEKCPSKLLVWLSILSLFIVQLALVYLVLKNSDFLRLYKLNTRKALSIGLYSFAALFLIFLAGLCIYCKTYIYIIPMVVSAAPTALYTFYKEKLITFLFLKHKPYS